MKFSTKENREANCLIRVGIKKAIYGKGDLYAGQEDIPLMKRKTPAYAVLTTFLNLLKKWAPILLL